MPGKKRYFSKKFHKQWDDKVIGISNGLTILEPTKNGHWKSPEGQLFSERMIPVRVICSSEQIHKIMDITANHYKQLAILAYKVSNEVILKNY